MNKPLKWSRRKFSKAAVSAQLLLGAGFFPVATGCETQDSENGEILNSGQLKILEAAMDEIVPASGPMPSPSSIGGLEYVLGVLEKYPELAAPLRQILQDLDQINAHGFANLDKNLRIEVLKEYENSQPERFSVLVNFTYEGYYTNETIWNLIGYEPYPTLSAGPEMEPFDERLLERVKKYPSLYLDVRS